MSFIPVRDKLKKFVSVDRNQSEKFDYISTIVKDFIRNGHAAHMTIPGYDKTKPEIEAFMTLKGINIPILTKSNTVNLQRIS